MKKIISVVVLIFSACTSAHEGFYSDENVEFSFSQSVTLNGLSPEPISLVLEKTSNGKETEIWLHDEKQPSRRGAGYIHIYEATSKEDADRFLEQEIGKHCSFIVVDSENGIEKLVAREKDANPDGPFCVHAAYNLFRKNNTIIYHYIGQECVFNTIDPRAKHECEEFIDFRVK